MPAAPERDADSPLAREYNPFAAFLSYLVPGLGQISQGRIGKGVLFFVCVLSLFYYGMRLGSWSNVYFPDTADQNNPFQLARPLANLWNRPQFAAQFWVGVAAWPAIYQHATYDPLAETGPLFGSYQRIPYEDRSSRVPDDPDDADSRRAARLGRRANESALKPSESLADWPGRTLNELQNEGDKSWDLGWILTVIAGALNVLVIYDALAGPAFVPATGAGKDES